MMQFVHRFILIISRQKRGGEENPIILILHIYIITVMIAIIISPITCEEDQKCLTTADI